ncbi:MAG: DUF6600 domain-containing protein [Thermoanaerobaculia bacterium]
MFPIARTTARSTRRPGPCALVSAALVSAALAAPLAAQEGAAAYLRTVEGYADHVLSQGEAFQAAINYPVVPGDRLVLAPGTRLEVVLPDGSAVRAADEADLLVSDVAGTFESPAAATRLELDRGELQIVRPAWSGPEQIQVLLGGSWVVLEAPGSYRVGSDGYGTSHVTVREGWAEISTPRGRRDVRTAETAWVREGSWSVELTRAEARDELEWWGASLDRDVQVAAETWSDDPRLSYAATSLEGRGEWVQVSGRRAWRPWVEVGWRPYVTGDWAWTPGGMAWVSYEPWGWLTHHYGLWEQVAGYGWVWVPGRVYSPAWVYWYWGPSYVAWVPAGLYATTYASWDYQPSWGVYGWVSGGWSHYDDWTFCRVDDFRYGRHHGRFALGREVSRHAGNGVLERGVLATDTRPITRGGWTDQTSFRNRLAQERQRVDREKPADLTAFVARRPEASAQATRMFVKRPEAAPGARGVLGSGGTPGTRTAVGRGDVLPGRTWSSNGRPAAPASPDRGAIRPAQPVDRGSVKPGSNAAPPASRWNVRPAEPQKPQADDAGPGGSRWNVRPGEPLKPQADDAGPAGSRWNVRPPEPSKPQADDAGPGGSRWNVRPPEPSRPSYRPPDAEAWRDRIQLRPPSQSPSAATPPTATWPRGVDRNGPSSPATDRAPLVRRVLEEIQMRSRTGSSTGGWSSLRPPAASSPPERPEASRPPERPAPQREQPERGRTETRSRDDDPPSRGRSGAAATRGSGNARSRGGDPPR